MNNYEFHQMIFIVPTEIIIYVFFFKLSLKWFIALINFLVLKIPLHYWNKLHMVMVNELFNIWSLLISFLEHLDTCSWTMLLFKKRFWCLEFIWEHSLFLFSERDRNYILVFTLLLWEHFSLLSKCL